MYLKSLFFFFFGFLSELSIACFLICCKEALFAWTFTTLAHCDLIISSGSVVMQFSSFTESWKLVMFRSISAVDDFVLSSWLYSLET